MTRATWVTLQCTWYGWRVAVFVAAWLLLLGMNATPNPWDLLDTVTAMKMLALIVVPVYLFIVAAPVSGMWQQLTYVRVREAWWWAQVIAAGVSAVAAVAALAILVVGWALIAHGWSWHWGVVSARQHLPALRQVPPEQWAGEALGLLTVGLWSLGVLLDVLVLWWQTLWVAWMSLVLVVLVPVTLAGTAQQVLLWWLPGAQFSLLAHFSASGEISPWGSVAYAGALLTGAGLSGAALATKGWEARSS